MPSLLSGPDMVGQRDSDVVGSRLDAVAVHYMVLGEARRDPRRGAREPRRQGRGVRQNGDGHELPPRCGREPVLVQQVGAVPGIAICLGTSVVQSSSGVVDMPVVLVEHATAGS